MWKKCIHLFIFICLLVGCCFCLLTQVLFVGFIFHCYYSCVFSIGNSSPLFLPSSQCEGEKPVIFFSLHNFPHSRLQCLVGAAQTAFSTQWEQLKRRKWLCLLKVKRIQVLFILLQMLFPSFLGSLWGIVFQVMQFIWSAVTCNLLWLIPSPFSSQGLLIRSSTERRQYSLKVVSRVRQNWHIPAVWPWALSPSFVSKVRIVTVPHWIIEGLSEITVQLLVYADRSKGSINARNCE